MRDDSTEGHELHRTAPSPAFDGAPLERAARLVGSLAVALGLLVSGWVVPGPTARLVAAAGSCTGWTSITAAPATIRVLRSTGPASGTVQVVPFHDYVTVVMAAEWGSTNPDHALQAGAVAVKQYGWYHAMYWRGGTAEDGSCYDVVDYWADQVYSPETKTPAPSIIAAVDASWDVTLIKSGSFFATHYDAGSSVPCGTNADGWHLYQISAVDCARNGMTSDAILQTYYGPDVQVVRSTPGAASVAFTATPTGGTAGVALSVQPVVTILDATGQPVVTGPASTSVVSLELAPNAVGAVLQCDGGTTRAAVAGVATFAGCLVSAPGSGLLLTAQAAGLVPATAPLEIAPGAPTITLAAAPPTVTWGTSIAFTLTMAPPAGGAPVAGRAVHVERSADGVDWIPDRDVTTDASGNATWTERPATNGWYRATFAGSPDLGPATSGVPRVLVRQLAVLRPGNGGAVRAVARGTAVSFVATVRPNRPELAPARVQFDVYGLKGTVWTLSRTATVTVDSTGRATLRQVFASFGRWRVRAIALPTPANANSVWSPPEEYLVR